MGNTHVRRLACELREPIKLKRLGNFTLFISSEMEKDCNLLTIFRLYGFYITIYVMMRNSCLCVYLFVCVFIYLFVCLFICLCVCLYSNSSRLYNDIA